MIKINAIVYLVLIALAAPLFAEQGNQPKKITGAFGVKFGSTISDEKVIKKWEAGSGKVVVMFKPSSPLESLTQYASFVTLESEIVYSISAQGSFKDEFSAQKEADVIVALLEKKYKHVAQVDGGFRYIKIEDCRVMVGSSYDGESFNVQLIYVNESLHAKAEKEVLKAKMREVDDSGL